MQLRRDLLEGHLMGLEVRASKYVARMEETARKHKANYAFSYVPWGFGGKGGSLNSIYFGAFYEATYKDGGRIARDFIVMTPALRKWRWRQDKAKTGEANGWARPALDDGKWKSTDVGFDTWSALGMHNFMGSVWYRAAVTLPKVPAGKKVYLWVGSTDGSVKVFVNGKHVSFVDPKGTKADAFTGFCQPVSFDITSAIKPGGDNQISLLCTRTFLNELGTGGLLSPPIVYREKD